jgi:predicted amino acid racemase
MAFITLNTEKLQHNYNYLDTLFENHGIQWSVVSKMLCGNRRYLEVLLDMGVQQVCDSRVANLKIIKSIAPEVETVFIKPAARKMVPHVVQYADISFNTELETIKLLSKHAQKLGKTHKIVIMIELGELREGVLREDLVDFYEQVFELPAIEVVGIGANLTCMYGILPNHDKLIQLSLYKQLIEARFHKKIPYVSGGASVTIPLIFQNLLPHGVNHFRVGETLFLGTDVYNNGALPGMEHDVLRLYAQIIELNEKPMVPMGEAGLNLAGQSIQFDQNQIASRSYRAILDVGLLDVEAEHISPVDEQLKIVGASSDMIVIDLGDNPDGFKVGDLIEFSMDYMGALRLMHSPYVEKKLAKELQTTVMLDKPAITALSA